MKRKTVIRGARALAALVCGGWLVSCGGGGGGGGGWTHGYASSGVAACAPCVDIMLDPSSSGRSVILHVRVKGVSGIHAAAFDLRFDPTKLTYASHAAGTLLEKSGVAVSYAVAPDSGDPSVLVVGAAILDGVSEVSAAAAGETVVILCFTATATGSSALAFLDEAGPPAYDSRLLDSTGAEIAGVAFHGGALSVM